MNKIKLNLTDLTGAESSQLQTVLAEQRKSLPSITDKSVV